MGVLSGPRSPGAAWARGMGYLSENRADEGLALALSVAQNMTLSQLKGLGPWRTVLPRHQARAAEESAMASIDFDAAERERTERDGNLKREFALTTTTEEPGDYLNCYRLPDGRVVAADDPVYRPRIAFDSPNQ